MSLLLSQPVTVNVNVGDSAAGSDVIGIVAAIPGADAGAGSDALALQAAIGLAESGAGSDTTEIGLPIGDVGAGADGTGIAASIPASDNAAGLDEIAIEVSADATTGGGMPMYRKKRVLPTHPVKGFDFAQGLDAIYIDRAASLDRAQGLEQITIGAMLGLDDQAEGADSISIIRIGLRRSHGLELIRSTPRLELKRSPRLALLRGDATR